MVVLRRTVCPLTVAELYSGIEVKKREICDKLIRNKLGTATDSLRSSVQEDWEEYSDLDEIAIKVPNIEYSVDMKGKLTN